MIEQGEWVRCDAALGRPHRRATEMAATKDLRNLRRCTRVHAFLDQRRQQGWAAARDQGWVIRADPRHQGVSRNLCPRHALLSLDAVVLMPLRRVDVERAQDVALALLDASAAGQALASALERERADREALQVLLEAGLLDPAKAADALEKHARQARHARLLAAPDLHEQVENTRER